MSLILLEALGALVLLLGIVWWTMFSGRRGGELEEEPAAAPSAPEINAGTGPHTAPAPVPTAQPKPKPKPLFPY